MNKYTSTNHSHMSNRLLTPELIKAFDEFPIRSQEGLIQR
jgi:hypothetical protein